jgi:ankyrin repeat protein
MSTLSPLATHLLARFNGLGEALLCNAIFNSPDLFKKEKTILEVSNMAHDTAIQFSRENRLYKQFFEYRHPFDFTDSHWNRKIKLISIYPEVARAVFKYQADNTLLMRAVHDSPPAKVIRALLEVAPENMAVDFDNKTPLHIFCLKPHMPLGVLKELLSVPQAAAAAVKQDARGFTPLHYAIEGSASLEVVKALLAVAPEAAKLKTMTGWTPLLLTTIRPSAPGVKEALEAAENY